MEVVGWSSSANISTGSAKSKEEMRRRRRRKRRGKRRRKRRRIRRRKEQCYVEEVCELMLPSNINFISVPTQGGVHFLPLFQPTPWAPRMEGMFH